MKPTKEEVLQEIIKISFYYESEGVANVGGIAKRLNTTTYHVNKHIKTLLNEGLIEKGVRSGGYNELTEMPYPPIKGYKLTKKATELEIYQKLKDDDEKNFAEFFGF
ncbi:MAG: hypothetical protein GX072_03670 [Lysinibacillus sp.]|nr:hypothetical protein [Lysinibacillus sp.]